MAADHGIFGGGLASAVRWVEWALDAARRMIDRRHGAGIEITLVSAGGEVELVHAWGTGSYYGLPYAV